MSKQQLLTLIDQAAREGRTELDLSDQGLTELPPEIGQLTKLSEIDSNVVWILPVRLRSRQALSLRMT